MKLALPLLLLPLLTSGGGHQRDYEFMSSVEAGTTYSDHIMYSHYYYFYFLNVFFFFL